MTPELIVDHLTYINYCHNRRQSPRTPLSAWAKVFGEEKVRYYESRFQAETKPEPTEAA